jgi:23S rRNA (uracil747-C5)-methyltransferase
VRCDYFEAGVCRSCALLETPYGAQLAAKDAGARAAVGGAPRWEAPLANAEAGFRTKAKMVVSGSVEEPTLGILDGARGVDLRDCALHSPAIHAALPVLARFVTAAVLVPYDVGARRGELKHVLVTDGGDALMVRFVLRSTEALSRIRKHLPALLADLAREAAPVEVVSVNVLPEHKAVLEGEREIVLHGESLRLPVGDHVLHLRPRSFVQTSLPVASALYRDAAAWTADLPVRSVWDLFCGVGGFALHLARPGVRVTGVELSGEAVASALRSRDEAGLVDVAFRAGDAEAFAREAGAVPDLVVVNPPRRGLAGFDGSAGLADWLETSGTPHVLYSSCHAGSLARDLAAMPSYVARRARVYDMFPHTSHHETLVLLERVG